jgi:chorismate lyase / 3-hydroxybenzoate synthase
MGSSYHSGRALPTTPRPAAPFEYAALATDSPLPPDVLAAVVFGNACPHLADPRCIRVGLPPIDGCAVAELWRAVGRVETGCEDLIKFAFDDERLAGVIELDERDHGGLAAAARFAYAAIGRFQSASRYPHLLRVWNYFDRINHGRADEERYKQFCIGRAAGLGAQGAARYPAASTLGRRDGMPTLQVYWLAARTEGAPLENPRQVSAYRYPRQYGPAAPRFSRAMLVSGPLLLISGTASVVGHASRHPGDLASQIDETLDNLASVLGRAAALQPAIPACWGAESLLKVYLRERSSAGAAAAHLAARLPVGVRYMILEADICRSELLVEIDCVHGVWGR